VPRCVDGVSQKIEVSKVLGGFVDHVHQQPPQVDRAPTKRDDRCGSIQ
jgi:hypothetical protein